MADSWFDPELLQNALNLPFEWKMIGAFIIFVSSAHVNHVFCMDA